MCCEGEVGGDVCWSRAPTSRNKGSPLANHKQAIKRIRQTKKRTERNRFVRSTMRTYIKRVRVAVEAGDKAAATDALREAQRKIHKAATKGVIHRNQANRRVSRLTTLVAGMDA